MELAVRREQELHRAGTDVAHLAHQLDGSRAHARAQLGRHVRRRGFFKNLLVAALRRTIALAQVDCAAERVAEDLQLDMARLFDQPLQQQRAVAEGGQRFRARRFDQLGHGGGIAHVVAAPHAAPAAAGAGLDHQRCADAPGLAQQGGIVLRRTGVAGQARHADALGQLLGRSLMAQRIDGLGRGPDEDDAGLTAGPGEVGVLGQEAITGVHRARAAAAAGVDDELDVQVAVARRPGAQAQCGVGQLHVARVAVGVGIHRHGSQAHGPRRADHAAGDFSAIGNQKGVEAHGVGAIKQTPRNRLRRAAGVAPLRGAGRRPSRGWSITAA